MIDPDPAAMGQRILLKDADFVVTDADKYQGRSSVLVSHGVIMAVGSSSELADAPADTIVDCRGMMLAPGLINAHNHVCENVARGLGKSLPTEPWMKEYIYPINAMLSDEEFYHATVVGCADMMRNGTTAVVDMLPNYVRFHADAIIQAFRDCGMRACVAKAAATRSLIDPNETRTPAEELAAAETYLTRWSGHKLVKPWIGPSGFHACDPDTLRALKQLATAHQTRFNIHLSETQFQRDLALQHGYEGQIQWANEIGLLDGETLVAHAVWINEKEIEILSNSGALVAHNATSNQILASGVAPIPQMRRRGITIALGSDGPASNDAVDIVAEMKTAVLIHRVTTLDANVLSARDSLRMVTQGGAAVLNQADRLGRIEPGFAADIVGVGFAGIPSLNPVYDPIDLWVFCGSGRDTRLTMIDGRIVYHAGQWLSLNLAESMEHFHKTQIKIQSYITRGMTGGEPPRKK